jgi:hypothetical protein
MSVLDKHASLLLKSFNNTKYGKDRFFCCLGVLGRRKKLNRGGFVEHLIPT